jgi:hypothetical protein
MPLRLAALIALVSFAAVNAAHAAADATLFRLFLRDGGSLVSYGEFARVDDQVVFSMPVGGIRRAAAAACGLDPALQVDWPRTERYAAGVRAQRYADTRGEEDFERLSNDIARVLNEVALATDKNAALTAAEQARETLANWPNTHYGYRERDVREVVSLLDEAISDLRAAAGRNDFNLALVAAPAETGYEPILPVPSIIEQIDATFRAARLASHVADRVSLLQESMALVAEAGAALSKSEATRLRRLAEEPDSRGSCHRRSVRALTRRLLAVGYRRCRTGPYRRHRAHHQPRREGGRATGPAKAGGRPGTGRLTAGGADNARRLRLLRDRWQIRRSSYRQYQRTINSQLLQLVKIQPSLDAIRRLTGPPPTTLVSIRSRLAGGADRLQRLAVPTTCVRHTNCSSARGGSRKRPLTSDTTLCRPAMWHSAAGILVCSRCIAHGRTRPERNPHSARTASASVITPRTTRLVRAADLRSFRSTLATLATEGLRSMPGTA